MDLGWLFSAYSSHSIDKAKEVGPQSTKAVGSRSIRSRFEEKRESVRGDGFATKPGGIMEAAMWIYARLLVGSNSQLCCVGSRK